MSEQIDNQKQIQIVVFKVAEEEFGLEIHKVKEIIKMVPITPIPRTPSFIEGVINLRGQIVTVIDLAKRLNLKSNVVTNQSRIIVVTIDEVALLGIVVDEVKEVLKLPEDALERHPELISPEFQHSFLMAIAKQDKRLIMLIEIANLFSPEELKDLRSSKA